MNIAQISDSLTVDEEGIWTAEELSDISYPSDGNTLCFQLEDSSFWFRHRNECISAAVKLHSPGGPIVDVGGGNGFVMARLIQEGFPGAVLEPGPVGALNAKTQRKIPEVICATLGDAHFKKNSLAAIGLFDVLEHIEDDRGFVEQLHSILKQNGLLYMTVPAHQWLWSPSDERSGHHRRYTKQTLTDVLAGCFEQRYFTYFFKSLIPPQFLLRALPYRLGLARKQKVLETSTEHGTGGGLMTNLMTRLLRREVSRIRQGKSQHIGASCLLVARKI